MFSERDVLQLTEAGFLLADCSMIVDPPNTLPAEFHQPADSRALYTLPQDKPENY